MTAVYSEWTTDNTEQWRAETPTDDDYQWQPVDVIGQKIVKTWFSKSTIYDFEAYKMIYDFHSYLTNYDFEANKKKYSFFSITKTDDFESEE